MEYNAITATNLFAGFGQEIAASDNYPPGLKLFLDLERDFFCSFITNFRYDAYNALLEVGCMDGQLLMRDALKLGLSYLGIDLLPDMVERTTKAISKYTLGRGQQAFSLCCDVCNLACVVPNYNFLLKTNALAVFPFNGFGNLPNPQDALSALIGLNIDSLILTYNTTPESSLMRWQYYTDCGFTRLQLREDEKGILFTSFEGLHAYAYYPETIEKLLEKSGYLVETINFNSSVLACYGRRNDGQE